MTIKNKRQYYVTMSLCMLMGVIFVLVFSHSTSPFYPGYYGWDTAHFMTVGQGWLHGKLPYADLFDHKGPLIYFLNMLGFALGGGRDKSGISFIQIVFICFTTAAVFAQSRQAAKNTLYGLLVTAVALVGMRINYWDGDLVEEYCLPFICWSVYGLSEWYMGSRECHSPRWAAFYGITAGICLLTRATNAAPLTGGILIICLYLLKERRFQNFFQNAGAFLLGFVFITAPFILYFKAKNCLSEMIYDVLFFNVSYMKSSTAWILNADGNTWKSFIKLYFLFYSIIPVMLIRLFRRDYPAFLALLVTGLIEGWIFLSGYLFVQYPLVCLPQLVLLINEVYLLFQECMDPSQEKSPKNTIKIAFTTALALCGCLFLLWSAKQNINDTVRVYKANREYHARAWEPLIRQIPEDERSSFVAYGADEFKELYPITGITPCYKFYVIQDWLYNKDDKIAKEMDEVFQNGRATWILSDQEYSRYQNILDERYEERGRIDRFVLYRAMT